MDGLDYYVDSDICTNITGTFKPGEADISWLSNNSGTITEQDDKCNCGPQEACYKCNSKDDIFH